MRSALYVGFVAAAALSTAACGPLADDPTDDGGTSGPGDDGGSSGSQDGTMPPVSGDDSGSPKDGGKGNEGGSASDAPSPETDAPYDSGNIPPNAMSGSCTPHDWTMSASVSLPNNPPSFAADGLPPTRWSTGIAQAPGQYLQVDFGGFVTISQLVLDDSYQPDDTSMGQGDYPRGFDVLASQDGTTFSAPVFSVTNATAPGGILTAPFTQAVTARALRLQLNMATSPNFWSVHELTADCTPWGDGGASDAGTPMTCSETGAGWKAGQGIAQTGWSATAALTDGASPIAGAFDGNITTRWSDGQGQMGGEWFRLDMGQAQSISQVAVFSMTDFASAYSLELSTDDQTYTAVGSGIGAATTAVCFPAQSARYVRITQTGTGSGSWFSIYEINVFH
ncbi:MAG TPA: discoidin domain-containing protein [Polyangiaceae bacterium]